jgi:hypothetical protein
MVQVKHAGQPNQSFNKINLFLFYFQPTTKQQQDMGGMATGSFIC